MKPDIRIFKSLEELSRAAATIFVEQAEKAIQERGRFLVALNGGGTPIRTFQLLASEYRETVDWTRVHVFWGDERIVPASDPESSYGLASDLLLRHIPIPETNIHPIDGEIAPAEAAKDYSMLLQKFASSSLSWPRFDLMFLGMGEDGHTASLFPGSPVESSKPVLPVKAEYQDRPAQRVTLTPLVLNSARMVVFMAAGAKKAATLAEVLSDRYNPELYPVQRIDPKEGKLIWLVDEEAASKLRADLVRRYCEG